MNLFKQILEIFSAPSVCFQRIKDKSSWFTPLMILLIGSLLWTAIMLPPVVLPEQREKVIENMRDKNVPQEQIDQALKYMEGSLPVILGMAAVVIVTPLNLLIISAILFAVLSLIGLKGNFKQLFSLVTYTSLIPFLGSFLKMPLMFAQKTVNVQTNLALLMSVEQEKTFLFKILSQFDLFTIWQIILLIYGLSIVYSIQIKKSALVVLVPWSIWVILSSIIGRVFQFGA